MKVKVFIQKLVETEMEINDPTFELLNELQNNNEETPPSLVDMAIKAVEKAVGLPFGDDDCRTNDSYIVAVQDMDEEPILEW